MDTNNATTNAAATDAGAVAQPVMGGAASTLTSYDPVRVHVEPPAVTEAQIDAQLEREMERFAVYGDVEALAEGDHMLADMQVTVNGQAAPQLSGEGMTVLLVRGMMPDGFIDAVLGMAKGESRTFDFAAADASDASSVPDEFHVEVTLHDAKRRTVPELTDGFVRARLSATCKTVDEFRQVVREHLEGQAADELQRRREEVADAELAKRLVGTVPDDVMEATARTIVEQLRSNLAMQGLSLADYMGRQGLDERRFQMSVMMQARESLRQGMALDALFEHLDYGLEDADIDRALAEAAPGHEEQARANLEADPEARAYIHQMARRLKAHAWLMETAVFD